MAEHSNAAHDHADLAASRHGPPHEDPPGRLTGQRSGSRATSLSVCPEDAENVAAIDANGNGIHDTLEQWAIRAADPLGRVFLQLVLMVVLPLVF